MADLHARLAQATDFQWDAGNATKDWTRHTVSQPECEQVFFHAPLAPAAARPALPPTFASEAEERAFWAEHDTAGYVDWSAAERVRLPNPKPSTATISLRLPGGMLEELKVLANRRDVPYQSLLTVFLAGRLAASARAGAARADAGRAEA